MTPDVFYFIVFACFAFAFGACVASFLNVCIWRLPREESVVSPPSHCPNCNAPIRWYQNIPIVSWLCLRGRCANCRRPISARYVIVETLGGAMFLMAYLQWAMPSMLHTAPALGMVGAAIWQVPVEWLVVTGLILGSFIDLDHFYLPDRVTIGGMVLGVPLSVLVPAMHGVGGRVEALCWSLGGMAFGFLLFWALGAVFSRLFRKDALGFGDVKLIGAVGAFFGPWAVLFTMIVSSVVGSAVGMLMVVRGRAKLGGFTAVPYGPFLALGALVWMYWGPAILGWYMKLLAP